MLQDVHVPDDVWIKERKCLLMLLEARMLLRELVEYKVKVQRIASGNLTVAEIQHLLMVNNEDGEDSDFIAGNLTICQTICSISFSLNIKSEFLTSAQKIFLFFLLVNRK